MDVGISLVNVADAKSTAGLRHQLHQANRTDGAAGALVQTRFLIALRYQQKGVEPVLAGMLPEDLYRILHPKAALPEGAEIGWAVRPDNPKLLATLNRALAEITGNMHHWSDETQSYLAKLKQLHTA